MKKTQELEKKYFESFLLAYGIPDAENINYQDKPDVSFIHKEKNIGVEVTQFYVKPGGVISSEQKQRVIRARIIEDSQTLYEQEYSQRIEVSLGFNVIKKEKGLAKKIANLLGTKEFKKDGSMPANMFCHIPELRYIYVCVEVEGVIAWKDVHVHSLQNTSVEELQRIINEKEEKLKGYALFDEFWLLVAINRMDFSMDQEILNVDYSTISSSNYAKVLLYRTGFEDVIQVWPKV